MGDQRAQPPEVCFLDELPLDVIGAAPIVIENLAGLRSAEPDEFIACARRFQTSVSVLNCVIDVGIVRRHVSLIRRCALYFGVNARTAPG